MSVEAGQERDARPGNGGFEARGLGNDEVRGDASIRPAAHTELARIGDALRNGIICHGHVVLIVLVAPSGIELSEVIERGAVLTDGPTMRVQQRGDLLARSVVERFVKITGNGRAILA